MKVLLAERSSKMSFLELPLLVTFMHNRMSCRTTAQSALTGSTAPNAPVYHILSQSMFFATTACCITGLNYMPTYNTKIAIVQRLNDAGKPHSTTFWVSPCSAICVLICLLECRATHRTITTRICQNSNNTTASRVAKAPEMLPPRRVGAASGCACCCLSLGVFDGELCDLAESSRA